MEHGGLCFRVEGEKMQEGEREMGKVLPGLRSIDCGGGKRPGSKETGAEQNAAHDALRAAAVIWNKGRISSSSRSQGARDCRCRGGWRSGGGMMCLWLCWEGGRREGVVK